MRALVVTNMYPTVQRPAFGSFVRDQVEALRRIEGVEIALFVIEADGSPAVYPRAARELRRRYRGRPFDVVHAHFGLSLWPALGAPGRRRAVTLHGTDLSHPRSRAITLAGLRTQSLVATVSGPLWGRVPRWAVAPRATRSVLPCGVDTRRFTPQDRRAAREALGLDPAAPFLLFPADPRRAEKRHDRAVEVAGQTPLRTLGRIAPERVPLWINAANAVLVPSEREGFGLATLEALACDVPVLATPVGIAPEALAGVSGTLCAPYDAARWQDAVAPHLSAADPRISGRASAERYSADRLAADVLAVWRALGDSA